MVTESHSMTSAPGRALLCDIHSFETGQARALDLLHMKQPKTAAFFSLAHTKHQIAR